MSFREDWERYEQIKKLLNETIGRTDEDKYNAFIRGLAAILGI